MSDHDNIRQNVSRAYASVVSRPAPEGSCCTPVQKGTLVKLAGYQEDELEALPADAVVNSFGCGNPLAFSEVQEGDVVLDLGSGAGIDLLIAAKQVGPKGRVIGVDMTDEMIEKARQIIDESGLNNIEVRKGLIEDLPVESASVDWVISNCVINLSPEKEKVFAEIARVLKPGGQMSVSDVVAQDLPEPVRDNLELYNCCVAGAISEEAYCDGLRRAGLANVEVRERIEYDVAQIEGLVRSDQRAYNKNTCCGGETDDSVAFDGLAALCKGKVWSAKIHAQKPA
ncbi:MAG: arsenite methyltransferase [Phycisphaerales bacterium]|nr:MAG: arsenite methyltransferase [Phycisphaerales bacterium]